MLEKIFIKILNLFEPELAHKITIIFLKFGIVLKKKKFKSKKISTRLFNYKLSNPLGLAAGFDKNAEGLKGLIKLNFSFIEVGTITPLPQKGNIKPRIYRFSKHESIINSLGFPNIGVEKASKNLDKIRKIHPLKTEPLIGANIGINKYTENPLTDYTVCLEKLFPYVDFITVNVSSPNTPGLRKLQSKNQLNNLLKQITGKRKILEKKYKRKMPIAIKISPDCNKSSLRNILNLCLEYNVQSIIASNTSIHHNLIENNLSNLKGGVSGKSLFTYSNKTLSYLKMISNKKIQLIGVGGVHDSKSFIRKIELGADAVQLYSGLVFNGSELIEKCLYDLYSHLKKSKLANISYLQNLNNEKKRK